MSGQQTSFTVASAALLAYLQSAGSLASPNGAATPASLTAYLATNNGFVLSEAGDSIPNPWIAAFFANAGVTLETATLDHLRDLLNAGSPAIVNLNLAVDGVASDGASVTAIGVNGDGSIAIADPNPSFARTSLIDYLTGFSLNGHVVSGKLTSIVRFVSSPVATGAAPFTVASQLSAGEATASAMGACLSVDIVGSAATAGARFQYCDGSQPAYEADFVLNKGASLLNLSTLNLSTSPPGPPVPIPANAALSWSILGTDGVLSVKPASLTVSAVTDSAAFAPALSPGALISIFGGGFGGSGFAGTPGVTLAGAPLQLLAVFPFQINAAIPAAAVPGNATLQVTGPDGSATSAVTLSATSPGIFQLGSLGAILNADATLNTPTNPAQRGQFVSVYCTGLGATVLKGGLQTASATPALIVNGTTVQPLFAGLVAGFVGLYQINVTIPSNLPPSLTGMIAIQQGSQTSNTVPVAIQ